MPKATTLQGDFSAGELSPLLFGRTDSPRYKKGLDTGLNYIPTLQGPLARRPANKYGFTVKDSTKPPILIDFKFSQTQAYVFEFGDKYIRFYANNGQIVTSGTTYKVTGGIGASTYGTFFPFYASRQNLVPFPSDSSIFNSTSTISNGSILEIGSPYAYADLPLLRWSQNADTLYLFHPKYPVYKLQRFAGQFWTLRMVYNQDGPYLVLNSYASLGDSTNITLAPVSTSLPGSDVVSGPGFMITGAITDPASSGQIQITAAGHNFKNGQNIFIIGVAGTTEANNANPGGGTSAGHPYYWQVIVTSSSTFLLVGSTFVSNYVSGGSAQPALFWADIGQLTTAPDFLRSIALEIAGIRYWGHLVFFYNASRATVLLGPYTSTAVPFPSTATATAWQMGVWGVANGYPQCGTFHQDRLCLAGTPNYPQEIDGSFTGEYENFAGSDPTTLDVADDNAIQFNLNSNDTNPLFWMKSTAQALLAGTYSAEWAIAPNATSEAITPTNVNALQTSFYGSANADAVPMGNAILYIQRALRKVREMNYFFQVGTFRSTDMTELSEHITNPGITRIVVQKETQPLLWAIRSDGALLSMIYNRDDASVQAGWTRHVLGGQSDSSGTPPIVQSMVCIPSVDLTFDQVWMTVQRWINGANVIYIEYMTKIFDDLALQEDAFQGDCGGTYDNPRAITGISIASPCVVTAPAHGFSNGQRIRIAGVVGLGLSSTDINGNVTIENLVNETTFLTANVTTDTFSLTDYLGNAISSVGFGVYISGGQVRALVKTISGLTWLEGETVGILADGGLHPNVVVSSGGVITLQYPAAKVQIGYTFKSQGKLLRVEGGAADGTSIGKTRRTNRGAFQMHRIGDLSIGTNFNNLIPLKFANVDNQVADQATPLYSGIKREGLESAYDFESQICFQQSSMLPGMIQSITSFMEEQDV